MVQGNKTRNQNLFKLFQSENIKTLLLIAGNWLMLFSLNQRPKVFFSITFSKTST